MTLKARDKICIRTTEDLEIDIKRLRFRFHFDSDTRTIQTAIHILATMGIADFYQVIQAYKDVVDYDNRPVMQRNRKDSKIEKAGGVDLLIAMRFMGYTLEQAGEELNCRPEEVSRWLKRRGLSWKNLK